MKKIQSLGEIENHIKIASGLAVELVEQEARKILRNHPLVLNEFIMAMGANFFTDKDDNPIDNERLKYLRDFSNFIDYLDQDLGLKVSGEPMRFTVDGPKITEWGGYDKTENGLVP